MKKALKRRRPCRFIEPGRDFGFEGASDVARDDWVVVSAYGRVAGRRDSEKER